MTHLTDTFNQIKSELSHPYEDLEFLLNALKNALTDNGEKELALAIPWINENEIKCEQITPKHIQLYSLVFQLVNMVEINGAVQNRRAKEDESLNSINGLWANNFSELLNEGFSPTEIQEAIQEISIEPVLTAHPTEAKRATILEHYRELYLLLVKKENTMYTGAEVQNINHNI